MSRLVGVALILAGALLIGPQLFTVIPDQRLVLLGVFLVIAGGLPIADYEPHDRRTDGNRRG